MGKEFFIDPDFRRNPKTNAFCCVCYRDIKPGAESKRVRLSDDGMAALVPDDGNATRAVGLVGPECAKRIPSEYFV